ncbi:MAG TPA: orotate phosphoribosyltransferase [Stenomitos sp.]
MPSTVAAPSLSQRLLETGALHTGHFELSSGLHSGEYFQCARLLQHPVQATWACRELADRLPVAVDVVVGPALGGVIVAYEMARALGVRALFTERKDGVMQLRRGFELAPGERVLLVEDVVTTGLSAREAAACVEALGGQVVAFASLVDRSGGAVEFPAPYHALLSLRVEAHRPDECPHCQEGMPLVKPGSRPQC